MTTKDAIELWITKLNKNAYLKRADMRLGKRYAVCLGDKAITPYLTILQLEQYLLGVFNSKEFYANIHNN